MKRLTALLLALALHGFAATGAAQSRPVAAQARRQYTAAAGRANLLSRLRAGNVPHYVRTLPNGASRVVAHVSDAHLPVMVATLDNRSNVLEILHSGKTGSFHTMAQIDRKLVHTQFRVGTNNWRMRSWGAQLRIPDVPLYGASIQLTEAEAGKVRAFISAAEAEQGPEPLAGANWESGNLKASLGNRSINCVSTWTELPVGDNGEPLYRVIGLNSSYSANPPGLQKALESEANERVIGVTVYGRDVPGFGQNPDAPVFHLQ